MELKQRYLRLKLIYLININGFISNEKMDRIYK